MHEVSRDVQENFLILVFKLEWLGEETSLMIFYLMIHFTQKPEEAFSVSFYAVICQKNFILIALLDLTQFHIE